MVLSFTSISGNGRHSLTGTTSGFNSDMDEEEIDQLDSGLDDAEDEMEMEQEVEEESASTSKGRRKLGVRIPGTTLIPQDRLDNMLQAEGAGPHMSKEAIYMLSIATEEFVKRLAEESHQQTVADSRQHLQYKDISVLPQIYPKFRFLKDTIPQPISIAEAMERRAAKARELLEDDPAISATAPPSPPMGTFHLSKESASTIVPYYKSKARQSLPAYSNGNQTNGASSIPNGNPAVIPVVSASANAATMRSSRARDRRGRWSSGPSTSGSHEGTPDSTGTVGTRTGTQASSVRTRNRSARAREAAETPECVSHTNGATNGGSEGAATVAHGAELSGSLGSHDGFVPPGQIIGPASGYLESGGHLMSPHGPHVMTDNPGRTIYSQQLPRSDQR